MGNKRATQIGSVEFDHSLLVAELDNPNNILCEVNISEAGNHIVWQTEVEERYITLVSGEGGWIYHDTKLALIALYNQLETVFTLTYSDESTDTVRFAHEKPPKFVEIYEGAEIYFAEISFATVVV